MGMNGFDPVVFRRGIIVGAGDHRQQQPGNALGRDSRGDHHQDEYGEQFTAGKTPTPPTKTEQDMQS